MKPSFSTSKLQILLIFLSISISYCQVGGYEPVEAAEYAGHAWRSVPVINNNTLDGESYWVPIQIVRANFQQVAGLLYRIEVIVGKSTCIKSPLMPADQVGVENCPPKDDGERKTVYLKIYDIPWRSKEEIKLITEEEMDHDVLRD